MAVREATRLDGVGVKVSLVLAGVGVLLGGCALLPVRVVHISAEERARSAVLRGAAAEERGSVAAAREDYAAAIELEPELMQAWEGAVRLAGGGAVRGTDDNASGAAALDARLRAWEKRAPADPRPSYLLGRLRGGEPALECYRRAWRRAGGRFPLLLDPRRMRPEGIAGWERYVKLLRSLEPETPERDRRLVWSLVELGRVDEARAEGRKLGVAPPVAALLEGAWLFERGDFEEALQNLEGADGRWEETGLLRAKVLAGLGRRGDAEELLRGLVGRNGGCPGAEVLLAVDFAADEDGQSAVKLLERAVPRVVSPALRVRGAILWYLLGRRGIPGSPELRAIEDAVAWARRAEDAGRLLGLLVAAGDGEGALHAARVRVALAGEVAAAANWRKELRTIELLKDEPELLRRAWGFLREGEPAARSAALGGMEKAWRARAVAFALRHPDPVLRVLALRALRRDAVLPFAEVPAALAKDPDPRVRGAWILLAAGEGGDVAKRAIAAGLADPDGYVREVAEEAARAARRSSP